MKLLPNAVPYALALPLVVLLCFVFDAVSFVAGIACIKLLMGPRLQNASHGKDGGL